MEGKVADSINADAYNIQAEPYSSDNIKCRAVKLYFLGKIGLLYTVFVIISAQCP